MGLHSGETENSVVVQAASLPQCKGLDDAGRTAVFSPLLEEVGFCIWMECSCMTVSELPMRVEGELRAELGAEGPSTHL